MSYVLLWKDSSDLIPVPGILSKHQHPWLRGYRQQSLAHAGYG